MSAAMTGPGYQPSSQPDKSNGTVLLAMYWIQFAIALAFVAARLYARYLIHKLDRDDIIILLAMVLDTGCTAVQTRLLIIKGTLPIVILSPVQIREAMLVFYIYQPLQTMAVCLARVSVAAFLLRIVGVSVWRRYFLYFCIASTFVLGALLSMTIFLQCTPIRASWDLTIPRHCWDPQIWQSLAIATASEYASSPATHATLTCASGWNAVVDVCLVVLPVTTFAKLQMDRGKKIGVCILMSSGIIAAVAAAVKAWQYSLFGLIDITSGVYSLYAVAGVELLLIIACACIPTLKPIYDRHIGRHSTQQRNKNKLLSMPGARQPSRQQRYQPLPVKYNEDEAASPSSTPVSQPPHAASGGRFMHEEGSGE